MYFYIPDIDVSRKPSLLHPGMLVRGLFGNLY